jgi:negative regulator of sigma E activity
MRCLDLDPSIEAIADGMEPPAEHAAHVGACARCQARLRLARAVLRVLESREVPEPPHRFTASVMAAIRRERWRAEQLVDAAFNAAVAAGLLLILAGGAWLAWTFGWLSVSPDVVTLVTDVGSQWLQAAAGQAQMVLVGGLLLTSALALWWWVEREVPASA